MIRNFISTTSTFTQLNHHTNKSIKRNLTLKKRNYSLPGGVGLSDIHTRKGKDEILKVRDYNLRTFNDDMQIYIINSTNTAKRGQEIHQLPSLSAQLLGRLMTGASFLASELKGQERIILEMSGMGRITDIYAEAVHTGEIRGYVSDPTVDYPPGTPLSEAVAPGHFTVKNILYNQHTPYTSVVPMEKGDVTSDLKSYFDRAVQLPTYVDIESSVDDNGLIDFTGGILIQPFPRGSTSEKTQEEIIQEATDRVKALEPVSVLYKQGWTLLDIAKYYFPDIYTEEKELDRYLIDYYCLCSKESTLRTLQTLSKDDLNYLKGNPFTCQFCQKEHVVTDEEFENMIEERE